jgi:hypothetical protein
MVLRLLGQRKQRTRQHVIAAQSVNYVERFIVDAGYSAQRVEQDYGFDLIVFTYDENGFAEDGSIYMQVKAAEALKTSGENVVFDLDIRDYNRWKAEPMPVVLVLFHATARRAYWLYVQRFFAENERRRPRIGARWVRVRIPVWHKMNRRAVAQMRRFKQAILDQMEGMRHG